MDPTFVLKRWGVEGRYVSMAFGILAEAAAGTAYGFGIYSQALKEKLGYSQHELNNISSLGNLGLYLSIVGGIAFDALGPRFTGIVGAVLCAIGYILMTLGTSGALVSSGSIHWGWMAFFAALWQNGSSWTDTMGIVTSTRNFPHNKGIVLGVLKSFFGLSASIIAVVFEGFFAGHNDAATNFLLFLSVFVPAIALLAVVFTKLVPRDETYEVGIGGQRRMILAYSLVAAVSLVVLLVSLLVAEDVIKPGVGTAIPVIILVACTLLLLLPIPSLRDDQEPSLYHQPAPQHPSFAGVSLPQVDYQPADPRGSDASALLMDTIEDPDDAYYPLEDASGIDNSGKSAWEAALDVNFWLLFIAVLCGTGSGLCLINNISQLSLALEGPDGNVVATAYISILSVANCWGRAGFGAASDIFKARLSRPGWLTITVLGMGLSQVLLAFSDLHLLFVSTALVGLFYGSYWALFPAIIADVFGSKNMGSIYALGSFAPALGGWLASAQLAARVYTNNIHGTGHNCYGPDCYKDTFLILAGCCGVGTLAGALATYRLKHVYAAKATSGQMLDEKVSLNVG